LQYHDILEVELANYRHMKVPTSNVSNNLSTPDLDSTENHTKKQLHEIPPGTPSVLFFKATLPLKPATIALNIGHLAFQLVQIIRNSHCIMSHSFFQPKAKDVFHVFHTFSYINLHTSTALVFHYFNREKGRFFFAVPKQINMATNSADRKLSL